MTKQYLVLVQQKYQQKDGDWWNLRVLLGDSAMGRKRYYTDLAEAKKKLAEYLAKQNRGARVERTAVGGIGLLTEIDEDTANDLTVVDWVIQEREVTPFVEIERMGG